MRRHGQHRLGGTESFTKSDFEWNREFHLRPYPFWRNVSYKGRKRQRHTRRIEVSLGVRNQIRARYHASGKDRGRWVRSSMALRRVWWTRMPGRPASLKLIGPR